MGILRALIREVLGDGGERETDVLRDRAEAARRAALERKDMVKIRFLKRVDAGWLVAEAGEVKELLPTEVHRLRKKKEVSRAMEIVSEPKSKKTEDGDPAAEREGPPGAPPVPDATDRKMSTKGTVRKKRR